ncbi:IMS domain-containing protein [Aerosakkonema funiforme]|uniref:IMS domain-containing protein n=1 Tax=Aerosakkonema funiforme TaxID=1246630 RepID=UPI0035B9F2DC
MRIPLDYYRILGVPIQASAEQLQQAYGDRIQQMPRREYSEMAIAARKQLLDEAYAVLRDPEERRAYDASFLANTYTPGGFNPPSATATDSSVKSISLEQQAEPPLTASSVSTVGSPYPAPTIEIEEDEFIGALLILQELGEYELVLKLGRSYLNNGYVELEKSRFGDPKIIGQDIVLTFALACLELGREQWQQRRYEDAANTLNEGQELLLRHGIFALVRGEIQADLYKLRPYRVLELLGLSEEKIQQRRQGLLLLREMLQERGGMDGTGDDRSGLSVDDFLRFIQQLRPYLTSADQQTLFEEEARRPSAVATYLAVYALLARGFMQRQPTLIRRAKLMLMRLGKRQDVHLEQAVCALLLGQTQEASHALEFSGEYESLAFIREHSQGSPDLLPGLCLYSERWLQTEVFPHFRDLAKEKVSLKDYFADEQLQTSLEALPATDATEWEVMGSSRPSPTSTAGSPNFEDTPTDGGIESQNETVWGLQSQIQRTKDIIASKSVQESAANLNGIPRPTPIAERSNLKASHPTTLQNTTSSSVQTLPEAERVEPKVTERNSTSLPEMQSYAATTVPGRASTRQAVSESAANDPGESPVGVREFASPGYPPRQSSGTKRTTRGNRWSKLNLRNLFFWQNSSSQSAAGKSAAGKQIPLKWLLAGVLGFGVFVLFIVWARNTIFSQQPQPAPQPVVQVEPSPSPTPTNDASLLNQPGPVTKEVAQQAIETWLSTKTKAFGPDHQVDRLKEILANPALSRSQTLGETLRRQNRHREYKHNLDVDSIDIRQLDPNKARVEAQVSESAQYFQGNKLNRTESYDSNLRVRYELVRQNGQWRIRDMRVLP